MGKFTDKQTITILATLEERSAQIRELERELAGQMATTRAAIENAERYEGYWRGECENHKQTKITVGKLQGLLAMADGTADRKRAEIAESTVRVRDRQIADMAETIAFLRGWCAKSLGREPLLTDPDFREVVDDCGERAMTSVDLGPVPFHGARWDGKRWRP